MVTILPYQSTWPDEFQRLGGVLRGSLGDLALRIDHIGSTSIPDLAAKDRIDIQVTVEDLDPAITGALSHIGYQQIEYLTDHAPIGIESHARDWIKWVFKPPAGQRPTNLHVRIAGRANQRYALLFRDYLRTHLTAAQAHLLTDGGDDFPGLTSSDRLHQIVGFGIEKGEVVMIASDLRIYCKIFF